MDDDATGIVVPRSSEDLLPLMEAYQPGQGGGAASDPEAAWYREFDG